MKIIFMGTPDFAVGCLDACVKNDEVVAVFTQPDRPKGRGKKLAPPPVKVRAEELDIPVYQPEKIKTEENYEIIEKLGADMIIVVAYGQILSKRILDNPKKGCVNVHASLLPKYRGASPINWSIVSGGKVTGVTTMFMSEGLDEGDMILKKEIVIMDDETAGTLHDKLAALGSEVLSETLDAFRSGTETREPQNPEESTYAPLLNKKLALVDWSQEASVIRNKIRGLNPWPVAYTYYNGEVMKLFVADVVEASEAREPGKILTADKEGMLVSTGNGSLLVKEIQLPNKKRMKVSDFLLGHKIEVGTILG
jgi:methionyl-tRNA formyltransferase